MSHINTLSNEEALCFVRGADCGEIKFFNIRWIRRSLVRLASGCGWAAVLFVDRGELNYIKCIYSPDGRSWHYDNRDHDPDGDHDIYEYTPGGAFSAVILLSADGLLRETCE